MITILLNIGQPGTSVYIQFQITNTQDKILTNIVQLTSDRELFRSPKVLCNHGLGDELLKEGLGQRYVVTVRVARSLRRVYRLRILERQLQPETASALLGNVLQQLVQSMRFQSRLTTPHQ
jgi:hypothetical protein